MMLKGNGGTRDKKCQQVHHQTVLHACSFSMRLHQPPPPPQVSRVCVGHFLLLRLLRLPLLLLVLCRTAGVPRRFRSGGRQLRGAWAHGCGGAGRRRRPTDVHGFGDAAAVSAAARRRCTAVQQRQRRDVHDGGWRGADAASVPVCVPIPRGEYSRAMDYMGCMI